MEQSLGEYVAAVLEKKYDELEPVGLDLTQVTKYSEQHATAFLKFFGETAVITDWKSVFDNPSVLDSFKEDPVAQTMMLYLRGKSDNKTVSINIKDLYDLSQACLTSLLN